MPMTPSCCACTTFGATISQTSPSTFQDATAKVVASAGAIMSTRHWTCPRDEEVLDACIDVIDDAAMHELVCDEEIGEDEMYAMWMDL